MSYPESAEWETIWLGGKETAIEDGWFPVQRESRFQELSIFEKKITFGAITKDSDDIVSSYVMADFSGGGQIDLLTGADQSRYRHAVAGTESPFKITLPPLVEALKPSGASGTSYPALQIGDTPYVIFGAKIYGWDEETDSWGTGVSIGVTPIGKGTAYDGKVFLPCGASGYAIIAESSPGTPVVTVVSGVTTPAAKTDLDAPQAVDFEVWDNKIWALSTAGALCWSADGSANSWTWAWADWRGDFIQLDASHQPRRLLTYADNQGDPILYLIADGTAYRYDSVNQTYEPTLIQFPPHPDFGRAACVWRPGEDLHIAVGLSKITYTAANVIDPEAGLNRNDGMPHDKLGKIVDLEPEISNLYALVSGTQGVDVVYSGDYAFLAKTGAQGTGNGQFQSAIAVATGADGSVWVADSGSPTDATERVTRFSSSLAYVSKFGSRGSNVDQFVANQGPTSLDLDRNGDLWLADWGNAVIKKFGADGAYKRRFFPANKSGYVLDALTSVAIRRSTGGGTDRMYVGATGIGRVLRFSLDLTVGSESFLGTIGSPGTGAGQFSTSSLYIAVNQASSDIYVLDAGNKRVQQFTQYGTLVRAFGAEGVGDGRFSTPTAIAINPATNNVFVADAGRDDVQEFTANGVFVRAFGSSGSGDGQYTLPRALAFSRDGNDLYVVDAAQFRVTRLDAETTTTTFPAVPATASLHRWTGSGWHGTWEHGDPTFYPTWANVTATRHTVDGYRLWWGCTDGNVYSMPLRRTFHNPRAGWQAGVDRFAPTGYILTSRFDALMAGFLKKARRLVLFLDNATPTETIAVSYRVDVEDDNWISLGTATSIGKNVLAFDLDGDGFAWGQPFNWIQFRFDLARGDDSYQTPVLQAAVLNFTKVPQQAKSFEFTVVFPKESWLGMSGDTIRTNLERLLADDGYVKLIHRDRTYGGQLAGMQGVEATGKSTEGAARLNFLEIRLDG
ncbi:MAG: hypothetical protein IT304_09045 [Dehalococcoidia bacterium]|nr:hypothetical protein [Dehalococcoidia bacterium]